MSETIWEKGGYAATSCTSKCDACNQVRPGIQHTGPNGYVVICDACSGEMICDAVSAPEVHRCKCCGEECPDGRDCCTDEFPEPGEIRETGR